MENFPKLEGTQVALVRAEKSTGIILDEMFNKRVSHDQAVFTLFEDITLAQAYAEKIKSTHNDVEFIIYGKGQVVLLFIQ